MGLFFAMIDRAFSQSMEHFTAWLCLHSTPTSGHFTSSQSGLLKFHNMSTQHITIWMVLPHLEESLSIVTKTSNSQHPSVVSTPIHVLSYSSMLWIMPKGSNSATCRTETSSLDGTCQDWQCNSMMVVYDNYFK